jgi:short chain dehydrogenase
MDAAKSASSRRSHSIDDACQHNDSRSTGKEHIRMDLGLADAAVCVQGGSKGMGRAAAECFAADGARVAVMARGRKALDETAARLTELGSPDAVGISVDAADATSIISGFAELRERWGELNSLVCAVDPRSPSCRGIRYPMNSFCTPTPSVR